MFAMSAKLVPVWSVTIEPRLIGVPVAATPGFVPHDEVWTPVAAGLLAAGLLAAGLLAAGLLAAWLVGLLLLLLLLLLLHPARTPIAIAATATPASRERLCSDSFIGSAFSWLTAKVFSERSGAIPTG